MGNRFDYRFPILNLQKGKRNNGRYRDSPIVKMDVLNGRSPRGLCTLIFYLMRTFSIYNACIHNSILRNFIVF